MEPTKENNADARPPLPAGRGRVLVIEPESLLRWSITTYLEAWFDVVGVSSLLGAEDRIGTEPLKAVIVPDTLPAEGTAALVDRLRVRFPQIQVVLMLSGPPLGQLERGTIHHLEKPFPLAGLGALLGVEPSRAPNQQIT